METAMYPAGGGPRFTVYKARRHYYYMTTDNVQSSIKLGGTALYSLPEKRTYHMQLNQTLPNDVAHFRMVIKTQRYGLACVVFAKDVFGRIWIDVCDELNVSDAIAKATDFQVSLGEGLNVLDLLTPV